MNIKPSFFDDTASNDYSIWKKDVPPKKASEVRITQGILFKKSSRTNFWKSRFYVLFEDRLAYYKVILWYTTKLIKTRTAVNHKNKLIAQS